jgi:hypothetical protein
MKNIYLGLTFVFVASGLLEAGVTDTGMAGAYRTGRYVGSNRQEQDIGRSSREESERSSRPVLMISARDIVVR